jgi:hypothetical protein
LAPRYLDWQIAIADGELLGGQRRRLADHHEIEVHQDSK